LLSEPEFKGHIIALDLSQGMLEQAAKKLRAERSEPLGERSRSENIEFLRHVALPLPVADATFDAVCCLEVLELFPNMDEPLAELTRVLRPGGVFLSTRGTEESGRKAKVKSKADYSALLQKYGVDKHEITPWWKLFDRVIAVKNGPASAAGVKKLSAVLRCEVCGQTHWKNEADVMKCQHCGKKLSITQEGIVLN
jgi:ubiquinone/menaquinone biosynthesis C-methylase UbiE